MRVSGQRGLVQRRSLQTVHRHPGLDRRKSRLCAVLDRGGGGSALRHRRVPDRFRRAGRGRGRRQVCAQLGFPKQLCASGPIGARFTDGRGGSRGEDRDVRPPRSRRGAQPLV